MNISLQEWTEETHAARVPILNNPDVYRFLAPGLPIPYTLEDSYAYLEVCRKEHRNDLAVVVDGEPVGSIGLHPRPDPTVAELGYYLDPARHRQGIMSRAVEFMLARVHELMPSVQRVTAHVFDFNPASQALLRHCGFTLTNKVLIERGRDGLEHRILVFERSVARVREVTLEPWTEENAAARVPMLSDPRVLRWMSRNRSTDYSLQDSLEHLRLCEASGTPDMAIAEGGRIVGGIGMCPKHPEKPSFHYYVHPDHWGRGIATRAVGLFLAQLAHTKPHLTSLYAAVAEGNEASCRVLLHNGFHRLPGTHPAVLFGGVEAQAIEFVLNI